MERKLTKLENCHVEVLVTVDEATWKAAQEKAFKKLAANVQIDGFRKGKAPINMVKSRINPAQVMDEAVNGVLPEVYADVLDNEHIRPMAQPKVEITKISDTTLEVKFEIVCPPEIELGQYKGLGIKLEEVKVTPEDVENAVQASAKEAATLVVKDGEAVNGDTVVMDFVGTIDGVAFDGGSATNHELELGSNQFIPGFEPQLVGHKAGDHVEVKVTFPTQYTKELAGKDAVFACDIHEVKAKKLPEINDEFVKDLGIKDVDTVEALRSYKENELKVQREDEARRNHLGKIHQAVVEGAKAVIPEEIVMDQVQSTRKDMQARMEQSGLSLEQYLQILGQTEEDFMAKIHEDCLRDAKLYFVLDKVAQVEGINVTAEDLEAEMTKIAKQYNMTLADVKKALEPQMGQFHSNLRMQRVDEFLVKENA